MVKRFQAVYRRFYQGHVRAHETFDGAVDMLQWGNWFGAMYPIGVYDSGQGVVYLPRGATRPAEELLARVVETLGLDVAPPVAGTFAGFPDEEE